MIPTNDFLGQKIPFISHPKLRGGILVFFLCAGSSSSSRALDFYGLVHKKRCLLNDS